MGYSGAGRWKAESVKRAAGAGSEKRGSKKLQAGSWKLEAVFL